MTIATINTNKASGVASPFRRRNQPNFEENALLSLIIRGQLSSVSTTTADRIQRNSGTTSHSGPYVPRPGIVEAMEDIRDSSGTAPATIPQQRVRHSLDPPSRETRRDLFAILSEACRVAEACLPVEDDDESDDL